MAKKNDTAMLRMVAEVVVSMAGYMGSDFDQHKTGLDFLEAMKLNDEFRRQLEEAHRRVRARAETTLPVELLVPLKPVLVELREACAAVLSGRPVRRAGRRGRGRV